jgi:hypothetical protein
VTSPLTPGLLKENSVHVIMSSVLSAASDIHVAIANRAEAEKYLCKALHSVLIAAEQCRQELDGTAP